jgi:hypothetical protein
MHAGLFAHGPFFKQGHINGAVLMTDVYILLRQILCLSPLSLPRNNPSHIHHMLNYTAVSNACAHLYLSSVNMITSASTKPSPQTTQWQKHFRRVHMNITQIPHLPAPSPVIEMRVQID